MRTFLIIILNYRPSNAWWRIFQKRSYTFAKLVSGDLQASDFYWQIGSNIQCYLNSSTKKSQGLRESNSANQAMLPNREVIAAGNNFGTAVMSVPRIRAEADKNRAAAAIFGKKPADSHSRDIIFTIPRLLISLGIENMKSIAYFHDESLPHRYKTCIVL